MSRTGRALPATLSPALRTLLRRCLQKDPRQRVQAIGDVRLALEGAFETAASADGRASGVWPQWRRVALVGAAAIIASGAIVGTLVWVAMRPADRLVSRACTITPSGAAALTINWNDRDLAITPDGSRLVYVGNQRHAALRPRARRPRAGGGVHRQRRAGRSSRPTASGSASWTAAAC